jgi:hypothetical protein
MRVIVRSASLILLLAVLLSAAPLFAASEGLMAGMLDGTDELPLMPGLAVVKEAASRFDHQAWGLVGGAVDGPVGGIVPEVARGPVTAEAVRRFYHDAVPQLGWRPLPGGVRFVRDGEMLRLDILPAPADGAGRAQVTVRFSLSPE